MIINVDKLEEGMKLKEPILNNFGFMLLPAGIILSQKHINLLKTWSIKIANIEKIDDVEKEDDFVSEELLALVRKKISEIIKWDPRNEMENLIIDNAVLYYAKYSLKEHRND